MLDAVAAAKAYRKRANLSQSEFASRYGLLADTYSQWERGRRRPDKASELLLMVIVAEPDLVARVVQTLRPARIG